MLSQTILYKLVANTTTNRTEPQQFETMGQSSGFVRPHLLGSLGEKEANHL